MHRSKAKMRRAYSIRMILRILPIITILLPLLAGAARAEVTEIRDFTIRVNGKPVGSNQMIITDRNDGTTVVSCRANVRIKMFFTYTVNYQGTEVWKNGRLLRLDGQYRDKRKRIRSFAQMAPGATDLHVRFNQRNHQAPADSWTTGFYKLPPIKYRVQQVTVVDPSRGMILKGRLSFVGKENLFVAGQQKTCYRFRVTGAGRSTDLWYDAHHRLVRQEFVEMGYRTVIELAGVRR